MPWGATLVLVHDRSPKSLVNFVNDKDITYLQLTPNFLFNLLSYAEGKEMLFPKLRGLASGTAPISQQQRLQARQSLTANFCETYGSNEMGSVAYSTPSDQDKYFGSVGRLNSSIEAQIVDKNGKEVPFGDTGLVRFRCNGMTNKYIDNPAMTARHFRDGWFYTGDVATINDEGYLFLLGRADDMINNAGVNF